MLTFLAIQSTYETVEIALFKDLLIIDTLSEHKFTASKNLILSLEKLLERNDLTLNDISFIGANQGPGAFTSLRTVIATINGISFAHGTPLIGINALEALLEEYKDPAFENNVCLLNAFGKDVYFLTSFGDQVHEQSSENINTLLTTIEQTIGTQPVRFLGNGAELYRIEIMEKFGPQATLPEPMPLHCSIKQIGLMALNFWQHTKGITHHMLPIYLKEQAFKKSIN